MKPLHLKKRVETREIRGKGRETGQKESERKSDNEGKRHIYFHFSIT